MEAYVHVIIPRHAEIALLACFLWCHESQMVEEAEISLNGGAIRPQIQHLHGEIDTEIPCNAAAVAAGHHAHTLLKEATLLYKT